MYCLFQTRTRNISQFRIALVIKMVGRQRDYSHGALYCDRWLCHLFPSLRIEAVLVEVQEYYCTTMQLCKPVARFEQLRSNEWSSLPFLVSFWEAPHTWYCLNWLVTRQAENRAQWTCYDAILFWGVLSLLSKRPDTICFYNHWNHLRNIFWESIDNFH